MFADEAGVRSNNHAGITWVHKGCRPLVRAAGQRVSVQMLSAIGDNGQLQSICHEVRGTQPTEHKAHILYAHDGGGLT